MTLVDHRAPQAAWDEPAGLAPRATLFIIPGRGEEPGLYQRLGRRLSADAYRVRVLADPTEGEAAEAAVRSELIGALASADTTGPRVLVGSDTGALFAAALAAGGDLDPDALILAGLPTAASADGGAASFDEELQARTRCPTHRGVLTNSQLRRGALYGPVPDRWRGRADLSKVSAPVLAIHGEADLVSPLAAARQRYAAAPAAHLVTVANGAHDAFNDICHRSVAATIVLFLERLRLSAELPVIVTTESLGAK
jgi:alpha-beta hydrolase superfamily lysophospholipase